VVTEMSRAADGPVLGRVHGGGGIWQGGGRGGKGERKRVVWESEKADNGGIPDLGS
jgi:hypothetical protein